MSGARGRDAAAGALEALRRWLSGGDLAGLAPARGLLAWGAGAAAGAMSFIGVLAAALAFLAGAMAAEWDGELARSATLRLPFGAGPGEVAAALTILEQTEGVTGARLIEEDEMQALLAPWLGADAPLDALGAPTLLAVEITGTGPDGPALSRRLELELPGAAWDDHGRWRRPLLDAAGALRALSLTAAVLALGGLAAAVTLGARASLEAARPVIETLRLMGAEDSFIAAAFTRGAAARAALGGLAGGIAAALGLQVLGAAGGGAGTALLPGLAAASSGALWAAAAAPVLSGLTAWFATRAAARAALRSLG
ncbi:cell division protein FtsX [Rhodovulum sp. DZ06]|uniref:cell division protein FtsX n=1 Tax=Rhodovulum sp. DZ06 TaxID=3425126 RepID=UPI003D3426EE